MSWDVGSPPSAIWRVEWDDVDNAKNTANATIEPQTAGFRSLEQIGQGDENVPVAFTISGGGEAPLSGHSVPPPEEVEELNPPVEELEDGPLLNATRPFEISGSVGRGGKNQPDDVQTVQEALNRRTNAGLTVDGKCGPKTIAAITAFQATLGGFKPDGVIEPGKGTAQALAGGPSGTGTKPAVQPAGVPKPGQPSSGPPKGGSVAFIGASVGRGGRNRPEDVQAVQEALNRRANAGLVADGKCGPKTIRAITAFQATLGGFKPDGLIEPDKRTARALAGANVRLAPPSGYAAPPPGYPVSSLGDRVPAPGDPALPPAYAGHPGSIGEIPAGGSVDVEVGWGNVSVKKNKDGTKVSIKKKLKDLSLFSKNFRVWVIPCYIKGGLSLAMEGLAIIGKKTGGSLSVTGAGSLELSPLGGTTEEATAGLYGSVTLSSSITVSVMCTGEDGLVSEPFTIEVKASGRMGVKVELKDVGKVDVGQDLFEWKLFVVCVGRYIPDRDKDKGRFEYVRVEPGVDLEPLIAALEVKGAEVEAFVEQYAPEAVKKAAVGAATWAAESETAGGIADVTGEGLGYVQEKTGIDFGAGVEKVVQFLGDEHGETSAETTERANQDIKNLSAGLDDFHAVIAASGLNGDLRAFRTPEEYNAWQAEGNWRGMVEALVRTAHQRKIQ